VGEQQVYKNPENLKRYKFGINQIKLLILDLSSLSPLIPLSRNILKILQILKLHDN